MQGTNIHYSIPGTLDTLEGASGGSYHIQKNQERYRGSYRTPGTEDVEDLPVERHWQGVLQKLLDSFGI